MSPSPPTHPPTPTLTRKQVVLVLDTREQYSRVGHNSIADARSAHIGQMRDGGQGVAEATLGVGDTVWVAAPR